MGQMAYPNANRKGQPDAIFLSEGNQMDFFWLLCIKQWSLEGHCQWASDGLFKQWPLEGHCQWASDGFLKQWPLDGHCQCTSDGPFKQRPSEVHCQ
jgi:hypothetical protein